MDCLVHRINFYDYKPCAFTCLAQSRKKLIAAGRSDGSIDIYDANRNFYMVAHIPQKICISVEAIAWVDDRLFCTGALGRVYEIDIISMSLKVGTDEGFVNVFSTDFSDNQDVQTFPKFDGKIVSIACHNMQNGIIAVGTSSGCLLILSVIDGSTKSRFTIGEANSSCVVWCLLFVNGTLFSGDSRGVVSIWNTHVGALLCSFSCHRADVLTLSSNMIGSVYSAGVDGIIQRFDYHISSDGEGHWQLSGILRGRRDICGLTFVSGHHFDPGSELSHSDSRVEPHRLLAVGQDARLQIFACEHCEPGNDGLLSAPQILACRVGKSKSDTDLNISKVAALPFWPIGLAPSHPPPIKFVVLSNDVVHEAFPDDIKQTRCLCLLHYPKKLVLVRLGCPLANLNDCKTKSSNLVPMSLGPYQLAEINPSKDTEFICSTLSQCGKFIAYSDLKRTRLMEVKYSISKKKRKHFVPSDLNISIRLIGWQLKQSNDLQELDMNRLKQKDCTELSPNRKLSTNHSSSETDTDTDELLYDELMAKCFSSDHDHLRVHYEKRFRNDQDGEYLSTGSYVTLISSAHCLVFTPNSQNLILVTQQRGEMLCISVKSGFVKWKCNPSEDGLFRVYKTSISDFELEFGYILCSCCTDGRVRLYNSSNGQLMFVCSCLDSPIGHTPLPVMSTFSSLIQNDHQVVSNDISSSSAKFSISILYTNNQFREWSFNIKSSNTILENNFRHGDNLFDLSSNLSKWPIHFWKTMGDEINESVGLFHSIQYLAPNKWLLSTNRYIMLLTSLEGDYEPGMVSYMIKKKVNTYSNSCIKILKDYQGILQLHVLSSTEFALVSIHAASISLMLSSPMQRKRFRT